MKDFSHLFTYFNTPNNSIDNKISSIDDHPKQDKPLVDPTVINDKEMPISNLESLWDILSSTIEKVDNENDNNPIDIDIAIEDIMKCILSPSQDLIEEINDTILKEGILSTDDATVNDGNDLVWSYKGKHFVLTNAILINKIHYLTKDLKNIKALDKAFNKTKNMFSFLKKYLETNNFVFNDKVLCQLDKGLVINLTLNALSMLTRTHLENKKSSFTFPKQKVCSDIGHFILDAFFKLTYLYKLESDQSYTKDKNIKHYDYHPRDVIIALLNTLKANALENPKDTLLKVTLEYLEYTYLQIPPQSKEAFTEQQLALRNMR